MKSRSFRCPVCDSPLTVERVKLDEFQLFCAVGRCPSEAANDGATGETEMEAFKALCKKIDAE